MIKAFFPPGSDLSPKKMNQQYYDDVAEFGLVDICAMDFRVEDERSWLSSGPIVETHRSRAPTKSTSLDSIGPGSLLEMAAVSPLTQGPRHSSPYTVINGLHRFGDASGDGHHHTISPIAAFDDADTAKPASNLNRTFTPPSDKDNLGRTRVLSPDSFPNALQPAPSSVLPIAKPTVGISKPKVTVAVNKLPKQMSLVPPGGKVGLRAPAGPPVTMRAGPLGTGKMNRAVSMGNISATKHPPLSTAPVENGDVARPAPAQPIASRIPRPPTKLPAPSGIPSRIPRPGAKK